MVHTKEPWSIFTPEGYIPGELPTLGISGANGEAVVWYSDIPDGGIYNDNDASRIVACVNACAGISTESLEAAGKSIHAKSSLNGYLDMKKQRDELLFALKQISDIENRYNCGDWDEIEEARNIAKLAIAKADLTQ